LWENIPEAGGAERSVGGNSRITSIVSEENLKNS